MATGNEVAPVGKVWVCLACGKRSRDLFGEQAVNKGWDAACVLAAKLFDEADLELNEWGRVARVKEWKNV